MFIRNGYCEDVRNAIKITLVVWCVLALFLFILAGCIGSSIDASNSSYQRYCEFAEKANSDFDTDGRRFLAENVPDYAEHLNNDGFFEEIEAPEYTSLGQFMQQHGSVSLILVLLLYSVGSFFIYFIVHDDDYYLADLPLRDFSGWFVLAICWVAWPIFIISGTQFWIYKERVLTVRLEEIEPKFSEKDYVEFCKRYSDLSDQIGQAENELFELQNSLEAAAADDNTATSVLTGIQSEISRKRADYNALLDLAKRAKANSSSEEQLAHDFEEIRNMLGVKRIFVDTSRTSPFLVVTVRAAYKYKDALYDLGDFDIEIFSDRTQGFSAYRKRYEGVSGRSPHYGIEFCFSGTRCNIHAYLDECRIVEAIELIIESINHINAGDVDEVPNCYKRIKN